MKLAIEHYEKFLDLRKSVDPEIAEMEDAKKRQAGLKSDGTEEIQLKGRKPH